MSLYSAAFANITSDFEQPIVCGNVQLVLHMRWDTANDEQYNLIHSALVDRAKADPLLKDGEIIRDYDWLDWYTSLPSDIEAALDAGMEYPQSLKTAPNNIKANILLERKYEADDLQLLLIPLQEQRVWNVEITDDTGEVFTGLVRPGGWINNQGSWSVRFLSDLADIGYDDLSKVEIEIDVAD